MKISNIMVSVDLGPRRGPSPIGGRPRPTVRVQADRVAARPVLGPMPVGDMLEVERVWALESA